MDYLIFGFITFLLFMVLHCGNISMTRNLIYNLHLSYYSIYFSFTLLYIILLIWLIIWFLIVILYILFLIFTCLFYMFLLYMFYWINDLILESFFGFILTEQFSLINGIKWLIFSEWMLFYSCFWFLLNFSLISLGFSLLFSYPLLSYYSFTMSISNLIMLIFSSFPIQSVQMFIKMGFFILTMEGLGQSMSFGLLFIILQCKEFLYSYFSLSDFCIFYFTTGLHGIHIIFGSYFLFILILIFYFSFYNPMFFIDYSSSMLLCSYYWHFIDWIWLIVYVMFIL